MTEYDHEPIRGLPGALPEGEHIVWQGSPDWRTFARTALFTRWIAAYFAGLAVLALSSGFLFGAAATLVGAVIVQGLLALFAVLIARTTIYTITNRRVVLRVGIALNKCINLPLKLIGSADIRRLSGSHGDLALSLAGPHSLGYAVLWPHARPLRIARPQPMLRALPDAQAVAELLAQVCAAHNAIETASPVEHDAIARGPRALASGLARAAA